MPQQKTLNPILFTLLALSLSLFACTRNIPNASTDSTHTLTHDGLERSYILHVPALYDENKPTSLVLDFHGGGGNADNQRRLTDFSQLADEKGFIVVYPDGTGVLEDKILTWNGGECCGYAVKNNIDDVGFIRALVAELQSQYNIDPKRIYASGFSNGGIMSYRLACDAADIFAAIAPISGTLNYGQCHPTEPVALIHFHGTEDTHVPYDGGIGEESLAGVPFTSVKDSVNFWLDVNQCSTTPQSEAFDDIEHDAYTDCKNNTAVELYTIVGGKHARPGSKAASPQGDQATQTISASEIIWEFFSMHPKP